MHCSRPRHLLFILAFFAAAAMLLPGRDSTGDAAPSRQSSGAVYTIQSGTGLTWQLVSAPYSGLPSFASLGINAAVWQPQLNNGAGDYVVSYVPNPKPPADQFYPGQGCWVLVDTPISIPAGGTPVDKTKPFLIPLKTGWNQVGNPFLSYVPLSNLSIQSASGSVPLSSAVSQVMTSPLYSYDSANNQYVAYGSSAQTLDPWVGAWLFTFNPATLVINPPTGAPPNVSVSGLGVSSFTGRDVAQSGPLPIGSDPPPTPDTTSVTSTGNSVAVGITTTQQVTIIAVSVRGSGGFVETILSAAARQAEKAAARQQVTHYALQIILTAVPTGPFILDVTTGITTFSGVQFSQSISFNVNVGATGGSGLARSAWPRYQGNNQNTGQGTGGGATGVLKWDHNATLFIFASPSIGPDGTVYLARRNSGGPVGTGLISALDPATGAEKWFAQLGNQTFSTPALAADGTLYAACLDGNLYALNSADGTQKWTFPVSSSSSPAIGADGTIYFGGNDAKAYAINPDGTQKWSFSTGGQVGTPAIGTDGTIYFGSEDNKLYALNPDGSLKWSFLTSFRIDDPPAIGPDGTIYVRSNLQSVNAPGTLYAVNPTGIQKWTFSTGLSVSDAPAVGADGTVYISSATINPLNNSIDNTLFALNPADGSEKWRLDEGGFTSTTPTIGNDGAVYIITAQSVSAYDNATGAPRWTLPVTSTIQTSPAIGADGTLYFGSQEHVYAVR